MSIFSRMGNIFKSKVNKALDEVENPIELLDQKLRDMEKALNEAKISSAQVLGNFKQTEKKMLEAEQESKVWNEKVKLAMSKGNEELAKKALQKKLECDKEYNAYKSTHESEKVKGEALKKKIRHLSDEIDNTRKYRDEAAARLANAEAGKKVNEILADVSSKSNSISLDDIERKVSKEESLADGLEAIAASEEDDLDKEFEKLGSVDLEAELEKYK